MVTLVFMAKLETLHIQCLGASKAKLVYIRRRIVPTKRDYTDGTSPADR
jgi:hypothetical protein